MKNIGTLTIALAYHDAGLNVIPLACDGTRSPKVKWARYRTERFPRESVIRFFNKYHPCGPSGIAIMCGETSGGLEVLDDDAGLYEPWKKLMDTELPGFVDTLPLVQTPSCGHHLYYRCPERVEGCQVLAREDHKTILIETKGQHPCTAPGSPLAVHPSGRPYRLIRGNILNPPIITAHERQIMLDAARTFNKYTPPATSDRDVLADLYGEWELPEDRPGDDFNRRADWPDILEPHGWTVLAVRGNTLYWRRPGSDGKEHHATTDYQDSGLMFVFSTSVPGFEASTSGHGRPYTKFAAYAILNHKGDWSAAAKELARQGYGWASRDETSSSFRER